jgi:hypothetical protein
VHLDQDLLSRATRVSTAPTAILREASSVKRPPVTCRSRGPVQSVLQHAGYPVVVLGTDDYQTVTARGRRYEAGIPMRYKRESPTRRSAGQSKRVGLIHVQASRLGPTDNIVNPASRAIVPDDFNLVAVARTQVFQNQINLGVAGDVPVILGMIATLSIDRCLDMIDLHVAVFLVVNKVSHSHVEPIAPR